MPWRAVALLLSVATSAHSASPPGRPPSETEQGAKKNWQDGWREDVKDCMRKKESLFTENGQLVSRRLEVMPKLLAGAIRENDDIVQKKLNKPKKAKAAPKPKGGKLTKKERMRQELLGSLSGGFDEVTDQLKPEEETKDKVYQQQAMNLLGQAMRRAKLTPADEVTLKEFCDMIWRTGNASPFDPEGPSQPSDSIEDDESLPELPELPTGQQEL